MTGSSTSDGFGNAAASSGVKPEYGYNAQSGYRYDGDDGLVHIAARYYDAQVGLSTTRDTFRDLKPCQYCNGDPVNCSDPNGHKPIDVKEVIHQLWNSVVTTIGIGLRGSGDSLLPGPGTVYDWRSVGSGGW